MSAKTHPRHLYYFSKGSKSIFGMLLALTGIDRNGF